MKTISSKDARNSFGAFLDAAQHEAIMIMRSNRPVGVMLPMDNLPALLALVDDIRGAIRAGVKAGLAEAEAGRGKALNDDFIVDLKRELRARIDAGNA